MNRMDIRHAVRGLILMDRRDLAADVRGRIDWPLVSEMPKWAENRAALTSYRDLMAKLPDLPPGR